MPAPKHNPKIDAYAEKAEDFAQPILAHLRALIHATCPEVIEEVIRARGQVGNAPNRRTGRMAGSAIRVPLTCFMTGAHGDDNPTTSVPSRRELNESRPK